MTSRPSLQSPSMYLVSLSRLRQDKNAQTQNLRLLMQKTIHDREHHDEQRKSQSSTPKKKTRTGKVGLAQRKNGHTINFPLAPVLSFSSMITLLALFCCLESRVPTLIATENVLMRRESFTIQSMSMLMANCGGQQNCVMHRDALHPATQHDTWQK